MLTRQVGQGSWCRVFRAYPQACGGAAAPGDYAVKRVRDDTVDHSLAVAQVRREALVAGQVQHPNLVTVLDAHIGSAAEYLVMPFYHGATVRWWLSDSAPLPPATALWVARQVAEALRAMHAAGWLHADVNPGNIILSPEGHVTLIDLGLACDLNSRERAAGGPMVGTPAYIAPEAVSSACSLSAATDTYSLGATLYEMLTGRPPFDSHNTAELAQAHLQCRPASVRDHVPQVSRRLSRLVQQMLAKQPLRRPTDDELVEWLVSLEIECFTER